MVAGQSSVSQNFAFPANAKYFLEKEESSETVNAYVEELKNNIRSKVWNIMFLNYYSVYSQNPVEKYKIGGDQVVFSQVEYNSAADRFEFSFKFNSYGAWKHYHPSSGEDDKPDEGNLFLAIDSSESEFVFGQSVGDSTLGQMYAAIVEDAQKKYFSQELVAGLNTFTFCYDYVTPHKRIHSNADEVVSADGYYHNLWRCSIDELSEGKTVALKTVNANRGWWYLVVLGGVVAGVAIALVTVFIVSKAKKSKKENKKEG